MFCCFFRQFNLRCDVISAVILSVTTNICIKVRNNASEQVLLCRFDLRWLTWQKGQCRADGPYFRSQEAPNPAALTETSPVCGGRNLSHSAGTSLHEPESLWPLGLIASGPHRFLCDTSKPCAIHLLQTAASHLSFPLNGGGGTASNQRCRLSQCSACLEARFSGSHCLSSCLSLGLAEVQLSVQLTHQTSSCRDAGTLGRIHGSTYLPLEEGEERSNRYSMSVLQHTLIQ